MKKEPGKIAVIRAMREDDLERIMEIDNLVLGERRPAYWQGKVEMTGKRSPLPSLVSVYTLVNWRDWTLLQFFDAMGFKRGDMINLEFKIAD